MAAYTPYFEVTTTVEESMVRLNAICHLTKDTGSGPDHKRNTGRTNDTSLHTLSDLPRRNHYYDISIPSTAHVPLENPTSLTLYDEAAHGKGLSTNKTFGDHDTKPSGARGPTVHTTVYLGKKSTPTGSETG